MREAAKFVLGIAVVGAVIYLILGLAMPLLQTVTAATSSMLMTVLGVPATAEGALVTFAGMQAQIIPLCVGDIEIAILVAAVLVTADRKLVERVWGAVAGFVFVMVWNPIRIALTLNSFVWFGWPAVELIHDVLFRLTLVVVLVGFYAAWYSWERIKKMAARKKR